jgi:hypothetical protein
MIAAAVIWLVLAWAVVDGALWARAMRRARQMRDAWPPGRVVATAADISETF